MTDRRHYPVPRLGEAPDSPFPDPERSDHPEGLVAWGGDLHPVRLLNAYAAGIFPWFEPGGPILWWCPEPRAVMIPGSMHVSRRLRRQIRSGDYRITLDQAFDQVLAGCAAPRPDQGGTWITAEMRRAYGELHALGHAHSLEVWQDDQLTGGVYGVAQGKIFFAESKFHRRPNASKIALHALLQRLRAWGFLLMDCQLWNPHLERLGVHLVTREDFRQAVRVGRAMPDLIGSWSGRDGADAPANTHHSP